MKLCIYGGHYGSEGKGAAAEFWIEQMRASGHRRIVAFGENSPNSGHTCSLGKTKNIPASSFFANVVILGPDSVVDIESLAVDLELVRAKNPDVEVYLHENAAWMIPSQKKAEEISDLESRISSTLSGSGQARSDKYLHRNEMYTVSGTSPSTRALLALGVRLINRYGWMHLVNHMLTDYDWIFECSQGALLDTNWGIYPFVTSRTTLPQAAICRNGLGAFDWQYVGVYRTFPIRTGGNSGPTGGEETAFPVIGVKTEIATVTKRVRRVFDFNACDFELSLFLTQPHIVMFTHLDYLMASGQITSGEHCYDEFYQWLIDTGVERSSLTSRRLYVSASPGKFVQLNVSSLAEASLDREMSIIPN